MSSSPRIVPFEQQHLDEAGRLLAERQARLHPLEPGFTQRWADPAAARGLVQAAAGADRASGVLALQGGRMVGFLVGQLRLDPPWERSGWVDLAGHAVDLSHPDVARDLFAAWSEPLVREMGAFRFLVNVPLRDRDAIDAWHQMNFGQMHAYALRSTDGAGLGEMPTGITVRTAGPGDESIMEATSELIWREQVGAPSYSPITPEQVASLRADYVEELTLHDQVWVAVDDATGEVLGVSVSYRMDPDLDVPDDNMKLASTTTFPAARRRGVARLLVAEVLRNARELGAGWCVTDWRTSSLRASRSWTSLGFRPTHVRLERRLDERVGWADGTA